MNRTIIGIFTILYSINVCSQDNSAGVNKIHTLSFKSQYIQIKDQFNYGLAFSGPNLLTGYCFSKITNKTKLTYSTEIAFGGVFNKGAGFAWRFKPFDIFYGRVISSKNLTIGAYIASDYQWQQYVELQGGHLFWFSTIEIGPRIEYVFPYKSSFLNFSLSNSLAGLSSRPEPSTETYFYQFSFSEFISVAHQNLTFGSYNLFNRTTLGIDFKKDTWQRMVIGYSFDFFVYKHESTLRFLSHSLNFNWKINGK